MVAHLTFSGADLDCGNRLDVEIVERLAAVSRNLGGIETDNDSENFWLTPEKQVLRRTGTYGDYRWYAYSLDCIDTWDIMSGIFDDAELMEIGVVPVDRATVQKI